MKAPTLPAATAPLLPADQAVGRAKAVGHQVAAPFADKVDREARFPRETLAALRSEGLLGALVPVELGGMGCTLRQAGQTVEAIGRHCASSAMVLAMHHLQVACVARHGGTPALQARLAEVAGSQALLASATTEANIGGQLRTSACALEDGPDGFHLEKAAPVVSYGAYADAILATARRSPDSPPNDQVLVWCAPEGTRLTQTGGWDTLGMRGTCSAGFLLEADGPWDHVFPEPFADIAAQTMLAVSHILWGYVWVGIAGAAFERARSFVQHQARAKPGDSPLGAGSLAELTVVYQQLRALVDEGARTHDAAWSSGAEAGIAATVDHNSLKVAASRLVVEVVTKALTVCGIAAYREDSPYCLGRHLRDAHGGAVMVNNDRILADNAQLLLVHKGER